MARSNVSSAPDIVVISRIEELLAKTPQTEDVKTLARNIREFKFKYVNASESPTRAKEFWTLLRGINFKSRSLVRQVFDGFLHLEYDYLVMHHRIEPIGFGERVDALLHRGRYDGVTKQRNPVKERIIEKLKRI